MDCRSGFSASFFGLRITSYASYHTPGFSGKLGWLKSDRKQGAWTRNEDNGREKKELRNRLTTCEMERVKPWSQPESINLVNPRLIEFP
jgi:hypothetical protein